MLQIKDIHTWYGDTYILQGVSLEVKDATIVALLGRNGMGKTTTIRSIMGFTPPRKGSIVFNGQETGRSADPQDRPAGHRAHPPGEADLLLAVGGREPEDGCAHVAARTTPGLSRRCSRSFRSWPSGARTRATSCSGGEQQMLTIARALMTNPDLLLFDEPSGGSGPRGRRRGLQGHHANSRRLASRSSWWNRTSAWP